MYFNYSNHCTLNWHYLLLWMRVWVNKLRSWYKKYQVWVLLMNWCDSTNFSGPRIRTLFRNCVSHRVISNPWTEDGLAQSMMKECRLHREKDNNFLSVEGYVENSARDEFYPSTYFPPQLVSLPEILISGWKNDKMILSTICPLHSNSR